MRIARIDSYGNEWVAFVRVSTDDGAEGWGQVAPYNADITTEVLHRQVAPHALGMDPLDPQAVATRVLDAEHKFPGSYVCRALAGRRHRALGPPRPARGSGGERAPRVARRDRSTPTRRACAATSRRRRRPPRLAALRDRHGFTAFKIRVGRECGHDQDEWPGRTEAVVPAVRAAVGADARLLVDANSCYTPGPGDRGRAVSRAARRRALRGAVPVLGGRVDGRGGARARRWTSPAASRTACSRAGGRSSSGAPWTSSSPTSATSAASRARWQSRRWPRTPACHASRTRPTCRS